MSPGPHQSQHGNVWSSWLERLTALRNVPAVLRILWDSERWVVTAGLIARFVLDDAPPGDEHASLFEPLARWHRAILVPQRPPSSSNRDASPGEADPVGTRSPRNPASSRSRPRIVSLLPKRGLGLIGHIGLIGPIGLMSCRFPQPRGIPSPENFRLIAVAESWQSLLVAYSESLSFPNRNLVMRSLTFVSKIHGKHIRSRRLGDGQKRRPAS
jgi:hypothetical protein